MSVSVKYKGNEIASMSETGTKTLLTGGKYCDANIVVENTRDGGGGGGRDESVEAALISDVSTSFPTTYKNAVATKIRGACFNNYTELVSVEFPAVTIIGVQGFQNCKLLKRADFGALVNISVWAFNVCSALEALIIRTNSVCILGGTNAFSNNSGISAGTGYIYVPSALVDSYKSATNWSTYASQIRAIEDYPSITGG